jgi:hypothetical protein
MENVHATPVDAGSTPANPPPLKEAIAVGFSLMISAQPSRKRPLMISL